MTELQEIRLGYTPSSAPTTTLRVDTNCGPVTVTMSGDPDNPALFPLVTLHDFGFDHVSQFQTFQKSGEEAARFLAQFRTYHIDLPGCEEGAGDVTGPVPTLDELASVIAHVRTSCSITDKMVLLGVGAGANIAMRYMTTHTKTVLGVILVEATNDFESWTKWTQDKITDMVTKPSELFSIRTEKPGEMANTLLDKHFGRSVSPTPILSDSRRYLIHRMLSNGNVNNYYRYYESFYNRKPLPPTAFNENTVVPSLVISARQSWRNDASVDLRATLQTGGKGRLCWNQVHVFCYR